MTTQTYFQFPLCVLAFGTSWKERFQVLLPYCAIEAGEVLWRKLPMTVQEQRIAEWLRQHSQNGFDVNNAFHIALLCGAHAIGIKFPSVPIAVLGYERLRAFQDEYEARNGRDALVRIRADVIWGIKNSGGLTHTDAAVLIAIYSCLGTKPFVRITRKVLKARALGYRNHDIMQREARLRNLVLQPLSEWQIRAKLMKLHQKGFFSRITVMGRFTFCSSRLSQPELARTVVAYFDQKWRRGKNQAVLTSKLDEELRNLKREIDSAPVNAAGASELHTAGPTAIIETE